MKDTQKIRNYVSKFNPGGLEGGRQYAWVEASEKSLASYDLISSLQLLIQDYRGDLAELDYMKTQFSNIGGWELYEGANDEKRRKALQELKGFFQRGAYQGNSLASPIRELDSHTASIDHVGGSRGHSLLPKHLQNGSVDAYEEIYKYGVQFFNEAINFIEEVFRVV